MTLLWKHQREELAEIGKLAQIALVMPLQTATCERVFSNQNLIVTKHRTRLSQEHLDMMLRVRLEGPPDMGNALQKWRSKGRILPGGE